MTIPFLFFYALFLFKVNEDIGIKKKELNAVS